MPLEFSKQRRKAGAGWVPKIRRWFPVSHDINRDPEMWEFRELIGKRADAIWDEILSIADRNEGYLPGNFKRYSSLLAGVCKSTARHLDVALLWLTTPRGRHHRAWVEVNSEGVARVANFTEYHRMREPYKILSGNKTGSLPSEPSEPSEPIKDKKKTPPLPPLAIPPWLEAEPW